VKSTPTRADRGLLGQYRHSLAFVALHAVTGSAGEAGSDCRSSGARCWPSGRRDRVTPAAQVMKGSIATAENWCGPLRTRSCRSSSRLANPEISSPHTRQREIWNDTGAISISSAGVARRHHHRVGQVLKRSIRLADRGRRARQEIPVLSGGHHTPHNIRASAPASFLEIPRSQRLSTRSSKSLADRCRDLARAGSHEGIPAASLRCPRSRLPLRRQAPGGRGENHPPIVPSFSERYLSTVLFEEFRDGDQPSRPRTLNDARSRAPKGVQAHDHQGGRAPPKPTSLPGVKQLVSLRHRSGRCLEHSRRAVQAGRTHL